MTYSGIWKKWQFKAVKYNLIFNASLADLIKLLILQLIVASPSIVLSRKDRELNTETLGLHSFLKNIQSGLYQCQL